MNLVFCVDKSLRMHAHLKKRLSSWTSVRTPTLRQCNEASADLLIFHKPGDWPCASTDPLWISTEEGPLATPDVHVSIAPIPSNDIRTVLEHLYADELLVSYAHAVLAIPESPSLPLTAVVDRVGEALKGTKDVRLRVASVRSKDATIVADLLHNSGFLMVPQDFTHIIVVLRAGAIEGAGDGAQAIWEWGPLAEDASVRLAIVPAAMHFDKTATSAWRQGHNLISSAALKLKEGLVLWGIDTSDVAAESLTALDVGASPGGWTEVLAKTRAVRHVVACDPAALHADVLSLPNVTHVRELAEKAMDELLAKGPYDILTCDANICALPIYTDRGRPSMLDVLKVLVAGGLLKKGCITLLTVKLPRRRSTSEAQAKRIEDIVEAFNEEFGDAFEPWTMLHLMANKNERTISSRFR